MTKSKTKYPIESFGPQLMQALVAGGREKVIIPFPGPDGSGKRLAHGFQRRIHTLRQRMREEDHPNYVIATRARVSIMWGEKAAEHGFPAWKDDDQGLRGAIIVIRPQDQEYEDALSKMTVTPIDPTDSPTQVEAVPLPRQKDELENLLDELSVTAPEVLK